MRGTVKGHEDESALSVEMVVICTRTRWPTNRQGEMVFFFRVQWLMALGREPRKVFSRRRKEELSPSH